MKMSARDFQQLVTESLQLIPAEFQPHLDNIQFVIETEPSDELLDEMEIPLDQSLYGLYSGTPLIERSADYAGFPDRITIYRRPLLEDFDDRDELRREVARTVLHEVAHHFGLDEDRLTELGWD
jgi:predicted Zn-dependent protease with MMP-like domain